MSSSGKELVKSSDVDNENVAIDYRLKTAAAKAKQNKPDKLRSTKEIIIDDAAYAARNLQRGMNLYKMVDDYETLANTDEEKNSKQNDNNKQPERRNKMEKKGEDIKANIVEGVEDSCNQLTRLAQDHNARVENKEDTIAVRLNNIALETWMTKQSKQQQ